NYARRGRRRALDLASSVRRAATSRSADGHEPDPEVNPLEEYFWNNTGRGMHKWHHYFDIYHRHLAKFRNRPLTVLEFGVASGGSLQMWKHYFGDQAHITGVDILEKCLAFTEERVDVVLGDQADRGFL